MKNKYYYKDGSVLDKLMMDKELHRVDGPAIEYANGSKIWFVDGKLLKATIEHTLTPYIEVVEEFEQECLSIYGWTAQAAHPFHN